MYFPSFAIISSKKKKECDPDFVHFNTIFHNSHPICIWNHANSLSEIQNLKFMCKLFASKTLETVLCDNLILDVFSHATNSCLLLRVKHSDWWNSISNIFDVHLEAKLCVRTENELFLTLLGRPLQRVPSYFETSVFKKMNANHIVTSCALYNRLCNQQIQLVKKFFFLNTFPYLYTKCLFPFGILLYFFSSLFFPLVCLVLFFDFEQMFNCYYHVFNQGIVNM